jgi:predicted N-formylglutamate amidohydrolase
MANQSFTRVEGRPGAGLLLLCDHASNHVPDQYGALGLRLEEFDRHIAYDIGAEAVTRGLARRLQAPALLTTFSRLLIDPNRGADDPTLIMKLSDGAIIPGNAHVSPEERAYRIMTFYQPYHDAIKDWIDRSLEQGIVPALLSIHSFTPVWRETPRPWHVGILWDRDARLPMPMINRLQLMSDLPVGDNEPYHGSLDGDTLNKHGTGRGLAHALVELRQDLVATKSGVDEWVDRLARVVEPIMNDPILHEVKYFGGL